jgi:hypothetical protein
MRIQSGEGLAQGRGTLLFVWIFLMIGLGLQRVVGADNRPALDLVCGFFALYFIWVYFKTRRQNSLMHVRIDGSALAWSTAPKAKPCFTRAGVLDLADAAAITVVPLSVEVRIGLRKMNLSMFAVQVSLSDGRTVVLPITSIRARVTVSMQRLLSALATVPGIVPVDASVLDGIAPAAPVGKKVAA